MQQKQLATKNPHSIHQHIDTIIKSLGAKSYAEIYKKSMRCEKPTDAPATSADYAIMFSYIKAGAPSDQQHTDPKLENEGWPRYGSFVVTMSFDFSIRHKFMIGDYIHLLLFNDRIRLLNYGDNKLIISTSPCREGLKRVLAVDKTDPAAGIRIIFPVFRGITWVEGRVRLPEKSESIQIIPEPVFDRSAVDIAFNGTGLKPWPDDPKEVERVYPWLLPRHAEHID